MLLTFKPGKGYLTKAQRRRGLGGRILTAVGAGEHLAVSLALHMAVRLAACMTTKIERPRIDTRRQPVTITPADKRGSNTCFSFVTW